MQLLVLILNKTECLGKILSGFMESGIAGATVMDSTGMLQVLGGASVEPPPMFGSLRQFFSPEHENSKTVFAAIKEEQLETARRVVREATGGLDIPNTGVLFCVPITFSEGFVNK